MCPSFQFCMNSCLALHMELSASPIQEEQWRRRYQFSDEPFPWLPAVLWVPQMWDVSRTKLTGSHGVHQPRWWPFGIILGKHPQEVLPIGEQKGSFPLSAHFGCPKTETCSSHARVIPAPSCLFHPVGLHPGVSPILVLKAKAVFARTGPDFCHSRGILAHVCPPNCSRRNVFLQGALKPIPAASDPCT